MEWCQSPCSSYLALLVGCHGAALACHDTPESVPVQTLASDAGSMLPNLWDPNRLCPVGFQLENLALDSELLLGVEDPEAPGQPSALVISQPRSGSPHSHVWRLDKAAPDGSTLFVINTRPPGAYLTSRLDARLPDPAELETDAGFNEFSWRLQRAGAVRVGGQLDDVTFSLSPVASPESALEVTDDRALQLSTIDESDAQLWKLRQFELCDL